MVEISLSTGKIREMELADLPALVAMSEEEEVRDFYFVTLPDDLEKFWEKRLSGQLEYHSDDKMFRDQYFLPVDLGLSVAGMVGLNIEPFSISPLTFPKRYYCRLSFLMGKKYHGNGLAEEAVRAVINYAFEDLDVGEIAAVCLVENSASRKLLERIGLKQGGEFLSSEEHALDRRVIHYNLVYNNF